MAEIVDPKKLASKYTSIGKNLKFAGVLTLTRMAVLGQKTARESIEKNFTLRNKWTQKGIRITPATKENEESEVFSTDWYIAQHEEGVRRPAPKSRLKSHEVPGTIRGVAGIPEEKRIPQRLTPFSILEKIKAGKKPPKIGTNRPFVIHRSLSNVGTKRYARQKLFVAVRTGAKRLPIKILFVTKPNRISITKRPWFFKPLAKAYDDNIKKLYDKAVIDAFKT